MIENYKVFYKRMFFVMKALLSKDTDTADLPALRSYLQGAYDGLFYGDSMEFWKLAKYDLNKEFGVESDRIFESIES